MHLNILNTLFLILFLTIYIENFAVAQQSEQPDQTEQQQNDVKTITIGSDESYVDYIQRLDKVLDSIQFVDISKGTFIMGSPLYEIGRDDDEDQFVVTLSSDFKIQASEFTQEQYALVKGENPSFFRNRENCPDVYKTIVDENGETLFGICSNHPVESVSLDDVLDLVALLNYRLSTKEGESSCTIGLPTEAQWEKAARCGTSTPTPFDVEVEEDVSKYVVYKGNSDQTQPVIGGRLSNLCGLYDVIGNVFEMTSVPYFSYPSVPVTDPGAVSDEIFNLIGSLFLGLLFFEDQDRVIRGGSWNSGLDSLRSAYRNVVVGFDKRVGFRLIKTCT